MPFPGLRAPPPGAAEPRRSTRPGANGYRARKIYGINPLARVVRVDNRASTFQSLRAAGEIREAGVVLTWTPGQASALDNPAIAEGRDVGTVRVRDGQGRDLPHDIPFAFAFHAFHPDGIWMPGT